MMYDAVILSGGRGSRLGGISKASLVIAGRPLVVETVLAAAGARARVVVGEGSPGLPGDVLVTREDPPFGGPAAALAAGLAALDGIHTGQVSDWVLVLACDMPKISGVVELLLAEVDGAVGGAVDAAIDGVVAVDQDGRHQYLAAVYRRSALSRAMAQARARASLEGASMRSLLVGMRLTEAIAPDDATADVDTWEDARRLHVSAVTGSPTQSKAPSNEELYR